MPATPDLPLVVGAFRRHGARFVVIGGMAVIAHKVIRTTRDSDLLIPDSDENNAAVVAALGELEAVGLNGEPLTLERVSERDNIAFVSPTAGEIDLVRGGLPPLDFDSVLAGAIEFEFEGETIQFAGLASLVAFKRLAGRPQDLKDLEDLELRWGPLPDLG